MTERVLRWLADENFNNAIVRGLRRHAPAMDIVRVQDIADIAGESDAAVLTWATAEQRILLTHDASTIHTAYKNVRRQEGKCSPVLLVPAALSLSSAISDIMLLAELAIESDWAAGVIHLPIK